MQQRVHSSAHSCQQNNINIEQISSHYYILKIAIRLFFHVPTSSVPHHVHPIPLVRVPFPIIGPRDPIELALSDDENGCEGQIVYVFVFVRKRIHRISFEEDKQSNLIYVFYWRRLAAGCSSAKSEKHKSIKCEKRTAFRCEFSVEKCVFAAPTERNSIVPTISMACGAGIRTAETQSFTE